MIMKVNKILLIMLLMFAIFIAACKKETTKLPDREVPPEVSELIKEYTDLLTAESRGWVFQYDLQELEQPVFMHLVFTDKSKLDLLSGFRGHHTEQKGVSYSYEGNYTPILVFEGNNVFKALHDAYNGSYKFKISLNEKDNTFQLVRSDGFDDHVLELRPATDELLAEVDSQVDSILAQIAYEKEQEKLLAETKEKIRKFLEMDSDFYFYNFTIGDFSATLNSIDTASQVISLTYKDTPSSSPSTFEFDYKVIPDGIELSQGLAVGADSIYTLSLGEFVYEDSLNPSKPTSLSISSNGAEGKMGYSHVASYPYTLTTERSISISEWVLDPAQQNAGLFLYSTDADGLYSDLVNQQREEFKEFFNAEVDNALATNRLVNQIYFPVNQNSSRNIQISTRNGDESGNRFFLYNLDISDNQLEPNVINIDLTTPSASVEPYENEFKDYLLNQLPAEGVNVVPVIVGTTLRIRLVSRKDSRYWVEYILNRVGDRSNRFD